MGRSSIRFLVMWGSESWIPIHYAVDRIRITFTKLAIRRGSDYMKTRATSTSDKR